jgi:hypothetical protein
MGNMNKYELEVVETEAMPVLEDLERRKMIKLRKSDPKRALLELAARVRARGERLSSDEIQNEVDSVRSERYARQNGE